MTVPLSKYLQKPDISLISALTHVDNVTSSLTNMRADNQTFDNIFERAEKISQEVHEEPIKLPRLCSKQTSRTNPPFATKNEYFRRALFLPCLDSLLTSLTNRFTNNREILEAFEILLPKNTNLKEVSKLEALRPYYKEQTSDSEIRAEYHIWSQKWENTSQEVPRSILSIIDNCDKNFFPNIQYLLCVLATLPVSTCEVERSFSTLKRIKNYLRNKMDIDRLNGLALMSIHYPFCFTANDVLEELAKKTRQIIL
uniref:52 kDa repressor of the inhibitor of the protein kinase n=1 Tax=Cacopsylla melanoneura TaxID=428564 RepID=A0A8D9BWK7_9HEMI